MKKTVDTMKCIKIISLTVIFALISMSLSSCIVLNHKFDYIDKICYYIINGGRYYGKKCFV